jgi:hypothetical protein
MWLFLPTQFATKPGMYTGCEHGWALWLCRTHVVSLLSQMLDCPEASPASSYNYHILDAIPGLGFCKQAETLIVSLAVSDEPLRLHVSGILHYLCPPRSDEYALVATSARRADLLVKVRG